MYNNLVAQAGQMELNGIPNDMIQIVASVACIIFGPIIQGLYNFLAKHKLPFGPMLRITLAFIFCAAGMAYAAGVQELIYSAGPCYTRPLACETAPGRQPNRVNVWIQTPTYCLLAIGEIMGFVTASEYAYNKSPQGMRTIVQALMQLSACVAGALGMAISPVAKDPHLVIMYACLAGAILVFAVIFWILFRKWDAKDDDLNMQQESEKPVVVAPTGSAEGIELRNRV
jgi:POT family proton-dependent oligopeptide transporter